MNMQFLNLTTNVQNGVLNKINGSANKMNIPNMFMQNRFANVRHPQLTKNPPPAAIIPETPPKPKMVWGPPIWFLFHTLAEKVKPSSFQSIRSQLLNTIYIICLNLPCPLCSAHAKEYMNRINFNSIQTKEDMKRMLFDFHNEVNKRKGFPIYSIFELDEKYSKAITINIIHNFIVHFQDKHRSPKLLSDDLQRSRIAVQLREWFQNNIIHFD
jgi:hypothetical protein